jgi:two-component system phosphate regulon sensor histidine kinase PhoR
MKLFSTQPPASRPASRTAEGTRPRRRDIVAFLVIVVLPCAILVALGVRLVEADRVAEERRSQEEARRSLRSYAVHLRLGLDNLVSAGTELFATLADPAAEIEDWERKGDALVETRQEFLWYVIFDHEGRVLGPPLHPDRPETPQTAPPLTISRKETVEQAMLRYLRMLTMREEYRHAVTDYESGGDPLLAAARLGKVVVETPEPYLRNRAFLSLASLHLAEGNPEEAVAVCERFIEIENKDPTEGSLSKRGPVFLVLARARQALGEGQRALEVLFWLWDDLLRGRVGTTRESFAKLGDRTDQLVGEILASLPDEGQRWSKRRLRFGRKQKAVLRNEEERAQFVAEILPRIQAGTGPPGLYSTVVRDRLHVYIYAPPMREPDEEEYTPGIAVRVDDAHLFSVTVPALLARIAAPRIALEVLDHTGRPRGTQPIPPALRERAAETEFHPALPSVRLRAAELPRLTPAWRSRAYLTFAIIAISVLAASLSALFLFRSLAKERRLVRLRSDFVSHVTHELKTPLTSITMFADTLRLGRTDDPEKQRRYYEIIYGESLRLGRLIDNVLDFSRSEAGRRRLSTERTDAAQVVERMLASVDFQARSNRFTIETDVEEGPLPLRGDLDSLERMLLNLVSNAMKFSTDEKVVFVRARRSGSDIVLEVEDRGCGIPLSEQEKIFQKFYRLHRKGQAKVPGTGLGLALVRAIVDDHRGRIEVHSELGGGAVFRVFLPVPNGEGPEKA